MNAFSFAGNNNVGLVEINGEMSIGYDQPSYPPSGDYEPMFLRDMIINASDLPEIEASTIVVGLDGTLADVSHRLDYLKAGDFDTYDKLAAFDVPNWDVLKVVNSLAAWHNIVIVTDRKERYRSVLATWLVKYDVQIDAVLMRPTDDYSKTHDLMLALLSEYFGSEDTFNKGVLVAFESKEPIIEAYRNAGIPTWQVR